MRGVIYDSDDLPFIIDMVKFYSHIRECDECLKVCEVPNNVLYLKQCVDRINGMTDKDYTPDDFDGLLLFCSAWLCAHELMHLEDMGDAITRH